MRTALVSVLTAVALSFSGGDSVSTTGADGQPVAASVHLVHVATATDAVRPSTDGAERADRADDGQGADMRIPVVLASLAVATGVGGHLVRRRGGRTGS
ncbi:MAG: hypothetical protein R2713_21230 [Ilumatobacteraceae bacterium]|nr:hypothetical protein [Acidimicrobiales bacterium]MCB9394805.1 hypothetical protein [Acidimicrobiaceae bacterium]